MPTGRHGERKQRMQLGVHRPIVDWPFIAIATTGICDIVYGIRILSQTFYSSICLQGGARGKLEVEGSERCENARAALACT